MSQTHDPLAPPDTRYDHLVELDLRAQPMTTASTRAVVRENLTTWGVDDACIDLALLLTSEVVTNATRHAPPPLHLALRHGDPGVRLEVTDSHPTLNPPAVRPDHDEHGGRGLWLVRMLSTRWGHTPVGTGKVVWFDLETVPALQPPS